MSNASPQSLEATAALHRYDFPHASGATANNISDRGLLPNTGIWQPSDFNDAFYSQPSTLFALPTNERQSHMTPSVAVQSPLETSTLSQPNSLVYNFPMPPTLQSGVSSPRANFRTTRTQNYPSSMIALAESTSPVSPVSLNSDDKSSIVSPLVRRSSNASGLGIYRRSSPMSDLQSEHEPSYKLPRIPPPKREGEPPRNADGKLICIVDARCKHLMFERKCEWR